MAITIRQTVAPASVYATSQTLTVTATQVGNVVALVVEHQAAGTVTITDNGGNTWTRQAATETVTPAVAQQYRIDIWTTTVATAFTTLTMTTAAASVLGGAVYELLGARSVRAAGTVAPTGYSSSPSPVPLAYLAGDFVVGAISYYNSAQANSVAAPFTLTGTGSGTSTTRYAAATGIPAAGGATGPQWTITGQNTSAQVAVAIAPSTTTAGTIKVYNGAAFNAKPVKVWSGAAWVTKPVKRWSGTAWITTT